MPWNFAGSRLALISRRLRRRFGIAAPKVAIRTHVPWYLRMMGTVAILGLSLAFAGWTYDFGRRMAGFDQSEAGSIVGELRQSHASLEEEVARLRSLLAASENSLEIEQAALKQLTEKSGVLSTENAKLKEELAVYERLARLEGQVAGEISIDRLTVKTEGVGAYRYSFLVALQAARRGKEAKFNLQIVLSPKSGTAGDKITLPRREDADVAQYEITLRNFRHIEGRFMVSPDFAVGKVEVRIIEAGLLKGSKTLML